MTAAERAAAMQHWGVLECPDWCTQADDSTHGEHQYEVHHGKWEEVTLEGGDKVRVRSWRNWGYDGDDDSAGFGVQLGAEVDDPKHRNPADPPTIIHLTADDVATLAATIEDLLNVAEDPDDWKPAYDGALDETDDDE